ncbi:MAG: hypothetical protein J0I29_02265 [Rhizobiales bacterium]|nr:hypothetical protein [Hyphomicrobiales bacterium]
MASKPKASGTKKGSTSKANKQVSEAKTQRERFIETAREIDADESGKQFEKAFKKVVRSP